MTDRRGVTQGDSVARNPGMAFAAQLTTAAFTAGLTLYLVRALGPDAYGVFALALALAMLILQPADLGLTQSAARFIADHRADRAAVADVYATALRLKLVAALAISGALFALAGPIADAYSTPALAWPLRAMAVAMLGQSIVAYTGTSLIALRLTAVNFRIVFSESATEVTASIVLVALGGGAAGAAWGRAIGYGVGAAIALVLIVRLLGRRAVALRRVGGGHGRRVARYAGAMFVIDGAYQALTQVDALVIGAVLNATQVGLFQAPIRLVTPLVYPGLAIAQAVAPRMSRGSGEPDVDSFQAALRHVLAIQASIGVVLAVWAEPITNLVLGPGYEGSVGVVRALAPYVVIFGFAPILSLPVNYLGEARRRIPIAIAAVLVNLVLDLILVPWIGIIGAAIGTNVGLLVYCAGHLHVCRSLLDVSLGPLAATAGRTAVAAAAMALVLAAVGTSDVGALALLLGLFAALGAYSAVLLALREFSPAELDWARRTLLRRD